MCFFVCLFYIRATPATPHRVTFVYTVDKRYFYAEYGKRKINVISANRMKAVTIIVIIASEFFHLYLE